MFEVLGALVTSILSGGVTGIIGVAVQRIADYKNKELDLKLSAQKFEHERSLRAIDVALMEKEWSGRLRIAETESQVAVDSSDALAFSQSFKEPPMYSAKVRLTAREGWLLVMLDFLRGIVRPGLTIYLCVLTSLIYWHARGLLRAEILTQAEALSLVKLVVGTVLYLTTTCILWWFGTRNKQKAPR